MDNPAFKWFYSRLKKVRVILPALLFSIGGIALGAGGVFEYVHTNQKEVTTAPQGIVSSSTSGMEIPKQEESVTSGILHSIFKSNTPVASKDTESSASKVPPANPSKAASATTLQIQDVKISVNGAYAKVTWTTSTEARSQLLLDNGNGKGYESINGVGVAHEVDLSGIIPSETYDFKIVAHTTDGSLSDDYYGEIAGKKYYVAHLGQKYSSAECRPIVVTDTAGNTAVGVTVDISGSVSGASGVSSIQIPHLTLTTNGYGMILKWPHCEFASSATQDSLTVK